MNFRLILLFSSQADASCGATSTLLLKDAVCCNVIHAFKLAPSMPFRHINHVVAEAKGCFKGCTPTLSRPGKLASIEAGINATPDPATTHASMP